MPDHGVNWSQLKPYNADLRQQYAGLNWCEARDWLGTQHKRLLSWVREMPEDALYSAPMPGGTGWTPGRYAEAASASHYRSATKYVRKRVRDAQRAAGNPPCRPGVSPARVSAHVSA